MSNPEPWACRQLPGAQARRIARFLHRRASGRTQRRTSHHAGCYAVERMRALRNRDTLRPWILYLAANRVQPDRRGQRVYSIVCRNRSDV